MRRWSHLVGQHPCDADSIWNAGEENKERVAPDREVPNVLRDTGIFHADAGEVIKQLKQLIKALHDALRVIDAIFSSRSQPNGIQIGFAGRTFMNAHPELPDALPASVRGKLQPLPKGCFGLPVLCPAHD